MATVADRLAAIVAKVTPKVHRYHQDHAGQWPVVENGPNRRQAPYELFTMADGSRRVRVATDDGGIVSGNGATTEAAVADLEKSLGLAKAKG